MEKQYAEQYSNTTQDSTSPPCLGKRNSAPINFNSSYLFSYREDDHITKNFVADASQRQSYPIHNQLNGDIGSPDHLNNFRRHSARVPKKKSSLVQSIKMNLIESSGDEGSNNSSPALIGKNVSII
jgi:hypothetical protein